MLRRLGLVVLTCGWLIPLWVCTTLTLEGLDPSSRIISFPVFDATRLAFTATAIWLVGAVGFWARRLTGDSRGTR